MTNMFKKSLIAIALASVGTSAMAADINSSQEGVSSEWINVAGATTTVTVSDFTYTIASSYTINDIVEFTFTGDSVDVDSMESTVTSEDEAYTLSQLSNRLDDNGDRVVVYRITDATASAPDDSVFDFGEIDFVARSIEGTVSVSTSAETNTGQPLDKNASRALIYVGTQYATLTANLNATIDVGSSRTQFTTLTDGSNIYGASIHTGSNVVRSISTRGTLPRSGDSEADPVVDPIGFDSAYSVTVSDVEYVLSGDFSFLLDDEGEYNASGDVTVAIPCDSEFEVTASEISFVCAEGTNNLEFHVDAYSEVVLPAQSFTIAASVNYASGGSQGTAEFNQGAGAWTLNGSRVEVPYMPYNANITQIINVTNRSAQQADISVVAIDEAGTRFDLGVIEQSDVRSIKPIAGQIQDALSEATGIDLGETSVTRRYAFEIITNAPRGSVEIYTAYNVGQTGARLVVNSSNGGAVSK